MSRSGRRRNRPQRSGRRDSAERCARFATAAGSHEPDISRPWLDRPRCRVSTVRHESAVRPRRIGVRHIANERADVSGHGRPPDSAPTPPGPPQPEASSVPGDDGLRLDNERRSPSGQHTREPDNGPPARAATAEAGSVAARAVDAAVPAPRVGARRANAPMCKGSGRVR